MEYESFENQRLGRNKSTTINHTYISSSDYRKKFDSLTDNKILNRSLYYLAKKMLNHRSGTEFEDMYWINADTGKIIAKEAESTEKQRITYSKQTIEVIKENNNLITIHSHPYSFPPSIADFNANYERGYQLGIVICHDGKVFIYRSGEFVDEATFGFYIADGKKSGYNEYEAQIYALDKLSDRFDIEFREVIV